MARDSYSSSTNQFLCFVVELDGVLRKMNCFIILFFYMSQCNDGRHAGLEVGMRCERGFQV